MNIDQLSGTGNKSEQYTRQSHEMHESINYIFTLVNMENRKKERNQEQKNRSLYLLLNM